MTSNRGRMSDEVSIRNLGGTQQERRRSLRRSRNMMSFPNLVLPSFKGLNRVRI